MGTSSGFFSNRNGARDTALFLEEKETTSIASNGIDAKERGASSLTWTMASGDRAIRRCAWGGLGKSGQPRFLAWTGVQPLRVALVEQVPPGRGRDFPLSE